MQHVRGHIVNDGYRAEHMQKDAFLIEHLLSQGLVDRSTYDSIIDPGTLPVLPGSQRSQSSHGIYICNRGDRRYGNDGRHMIDCRHRIHLPQVEEDRVAACSNTNHRARGRFTREKDKRTPTPATSNAAESNEQPQGYGDPNTNAEALPEARPGSYVGSQSGIKLSSGTELHIHVASQWITSLIGLSYVSSIHRANAEVSRSHSKMGGAVAITRGRKTSLYGVTTAHGVIRQIKERAPRVLGGYRCVDESTESSSSESEDGTDISDDVSKADDGSCNKTSTIFSVGLSDQTVWTNISHDIKAGFCGLEYTSALRSQVQQTGWHFNHSHSGDLALFPLASLNLRGLKNYYLQSGTQVSKELVYISEEEVQYTLPVAILLGPQQTAEGTLLPGKFHFSMCGKPVETTRVRLSKDLGLFSQLKLLKVILLTMTAAMGSSGSWVVHGQTLYGMIMAVHPNECLALMVPARKMLSDIRVMFPDTTKISVELRT